MSHVRRFDHVGITVADLDAVTAFFVGLGLEVENRMFVEGEFLDMVIGIPDSRTEIVMLQPPDGGTRLEHVAFEVYDLQAAVDRAATDGYRLVGGIGEYEGSWRMAYVRVRRDYRVAGRAHRLSPGSQIGARRARRT